jgi:hypothetical protein
MKQQAKARMKQQAKARWHGKNIIFFPFFYFTPKKMPTFARKKHNGLY